jgi:hypothetical protein
MAHGGSDLDRAGALLDLAVLDDAAGQPYAQGHCGDPQGERRHGEGGPSRAKGRPRPRLTARGRRAPARARWARAPYPPDGATPAVMARAAGSRMARRAEASAASTTGTGGPTRTTTSSQADRGRRETEALSGRAQQRLRHDGPDHVPRRVATAPGIRTMST